ncbi:MAG: hypothetical protein MMC33_005531 [Icmadophila ericetorum]|nr:hypothetical protein [Icmadophila ericetorum]
MSDSSFEQSASYAHTKQVYLPYSLNNSLAPDLSRFANLVISKEVLDLVADAERNPPYLYTWDSWGHRQDKLVTSNGWKRLQDLGISEGIVAIPYEWRQGQYSRLYQFAKYHLWQGSSAMVTCPSAMTDGAARLLTRHLTDPTLRPETREIFTAAYRRLISRNPAIAWTSGQWMTERAGGSDVSGTQTVATLLPRSSSLSRDMDKDGNPLGPYSISGFKWFSSATDANMAILLAQTPGKGVSSFYAPMYRYAPSVSPFQEQDLPILNGVSIQRLKSKLGTRALPTAELELHELRGYPLGQLGSGVKEISTILNITRIYTAMCALGNWGRGLAISRAFARVRKAGGGRLLADIPAHMHTLATQHIEYRAHMLLTFFVVSMLGKVEQPPPPELLPDSALSAEQGMPTAEDSKKFTNLLRLLTPITKAQTSKAAILGLAENMESLGGVGYLDSADDQALNIARLFRDTNVLSIWEGTTDIMADDLARVLKGKDSAVAMKTLQDFVDVRFDRHHNGHQSEAEIQSKLAVWNVWKKEVESMDVQALKADGRRVMADLGWFLCGLMLDADAARGCHPTCVEIARRWWDKRGILKEVERAEKFDWKDVLAMDQKIVFGDEGLAYEKEKNAMSAEPKL